MLLFIGEWFNDVDGAGLTYNQYKENACQASYLDAVDYLVMDKSEGMTQPVMYIQKAGSVDSSMLIVDRYGTLQRVAFVVVDGVFVSWWENASSGILALLCKKDIDNKNDE